MKFCWIVEAWSEMYVNDGRMAVIAGASDEPSYCLVLRIDKAWRIRVGIELEIGWNELYKSKVTCQDRRLSERQRATDMSRDEA